MAAIIGPLIGAVSNVITSLINRKRSKGGNIDSNMVHSQLMHMMSDGGNYNSYSHYLKKRKGRVTNKSHSKAYKKLSASKKALLKRQAAAYRKRRANAGYKTLSASQKAILKKRVAAYRKGKKRGKKSAVKKRGKGLEGGKYNSFMAYAKKLRRAAKKAGKSISPKKIASKYRKLSPATKAKYAMKARRYRPRKTMKARSKRGRGMLDNEFCSYEDMDMDMGDSGMNMYGAKLSKLEKLQNRYDRYYALPLNQNVTKDKLSKRNKLLKQIMGIQNRKKSKKRSGAKSGYMAYVSEFRSQHPGMSQSEAMKAASPSYHAMQGTSPSGKKKTSSMKISPAEEEIWSGYFPSSSKELSRKVFIPEPTREMMEEDIWRGYY